MEIELRFSHIDNNGFAHYKPADDFRKPGPSVYVSKSLRDDRFGSLEPDTTRLVLVVEPR